MYNVTPPFCLNTKLVGLSAAFGVTSICNALNTSGDKQVNYAMFMEFDGYSTVLEPELLEHA